MLSYPGLLIMLSCTVLPKAKIALLPLFHENANSVAIIKHAVTVTKKA